MTRTIVVEELARVEGHGGITVEMQGDQVKNVRFDVFEGPRVLESLMVGRHFSDVAPTISRICAICSAAHFVTSLKATEAAFGVAVSSQTALLRELLFRGENIESHALHVFLLAVPDYLRYPGATAMAADHPDVVMLGLSLKQLGNAIQETIGGRAIHPVNPVLGGFGKLPTRMQLIDLKRRIDQAIEQIPFMADFLAALPSAEGCNAPTVYAAMVPDAYSYSAPGDIAFLFGSETARFTADDYRTFTNEKSLRHSFAKHSTVRGEPFMVGALARLTVNGNKVSGRAADVMARIGLSLPSSDPLDNNKAQVVELVMDLEWCQRVLDKLIVSGLSDEKPVPVVPRAGSGTALVEAPRGLLVHSYAYNEDYKLARADVITPTAMNAASMERHFRFGVEQSNDKSDAALKRRLEMIARAYDPCISCSVHMVRVNEHAR
ncbi:MAG TPA: Ni/Fe hydrogenase subunit alpha [Longimicrobiales bacterium]